MGSYLYHKYETDAAVSMAAVRAALDSISEDDISDSSPVGPAGAGVATVQLPGGHVAVRSEGHSGDWTKTSEKALQDTIESVPGVVGLAESEGGYDG